VLRAEGEASNPDPDPTRFPKARVRTRRRRGQADNVVPQGGSQGMRAGASGAQESHSRCDASRVSRQARHSGVEKGTHFQVHVSKVSIY